MSFFLKMIQWIQSSICGDSIHPYKKMRSDPEDQEPPLHS